jgi:TrmH family RNA methyltransferase
VSLSKAFLSRYTKLHHGKGRKESGKFLVEGPTLVLEALKEGWPLTEALLTHEFAAEGPGRDLVTKLNLARIPYELCSPSELERGADAVTPQNAMALAKAREFIYPNSGLEVELVLFCEAVSDPGNLGTLLRTADWFGISEVVLGAGSADPFSPKVVRASAGSIFRVRTYIVEALESVIEQEMNSGRRVFAAVMGGKLTPDALPRSGRRGLAMGHETRGVSQGIVSRCTDTVRIPGSGRAESLNLSVAAGILMYELTH